uniref:BED-type domain-containing protein n=1 Tax=Haplochromis burtoni TaxID=8153 RepID=A0A3Q2V7V7_HAPBU
WEEVCLSHITGPHPHLYRHYFSLKEIKGKNLYVKCNLCPGTKCLSTSVTSNSNLTTHLSTSHASTKLVAKNDGVDATSDGDVATQSNQSKLDFSSPQTFVTVAQTELNKVTARYVVENMLPLSTVESDSFKSLLLKKTFNELEYISTTADIWTAFNKSYLGVTIHWINPHSMQREKAEDSRVAIRNIAVELDIIHSHYGISHKITSTVTDNGSNFVKAFKKYQPVEEDDSENDEDEVTFTNMNDALKNSVGDENDNDENVGVTITLPPHQRCASHTLSLVSCNDVDKWLLSQSETKAVYRSATTKCTGLWNKASRSTVAAETVDGIIGKKLLVPCTTRIPMTEREHQFIREYCTVIRPLTVALDILQGEDNTFYGILLETLMFKTLELSSGLQILENLPEAVVTVRTCTFNQLHFIRMDGKSCRSTSVFFFTLLPSTDQALQALPTITQLAQDLASHHCRARKCCFTSFFSFFLIICLFFFPYLMEILRSTGVACSGRTVPSTKGRMKNGRRVEKRQ